MKKISEMIREVIYTQTVNHSNVAPHQRFGKDGKFHLVSCAGHLIFTPKKEFEIAVFRDKYISRFEKIKTLSPAEQRLLFFRLFNEIRATERVKWKANLRTRLCSLLPRL